MKIPHSICPTCEMAIPERTTGGLCPACLLREAIEIGKTESALAETVHPSADDSVDAGSSSGDVFGDYDLLEEIARGGMGVVYKARHRRLNRIVALKMILSGQLASEQDIQRFQREAEAAANLDHAGIVPIYEIGEHGNQHFFSMKLVEGGSLADQMTEIRKNLRAVVRLLESVSRAVHYAHQRGILHRDLKPANILLDEQGKPMITDLGLARQIKSKSDITRTGAVVGTPAYMPPEQAAAKKEITTAVDIYAIGAMLYEALTGRPPHVGDSPVETLMQVMNAEVVPPREIHRKADRQLERICMKCLEKSPNNRYTSAAALADDLDNWLSGRAISVRRQSFTSTVTDLLRTNMRSAVGASVIGVVAGVVLAYCMSNVHDVRYIVDNPPEAVYKALPATIPMGRSLVFINESESDQRWARIAALGWLGAMTFVGATVSLLVRPKPGAEALAVGLVSGLFMAITLFTLHIGSNNSHVRQAPTIDRLVQAALGPVEQREQTRRQLFDEYPGLQKIPTRDRSRLLTNRIVYDGMYQVPLELIWGMTMSTLLCLIPCVVGTAFASKLSHEPNRNWTLVPAYLELMLVTVILIIVTFFMLLVPLAENRAVGPDSTKDWIVSVVFYLFFIAMGLVTYRRSVAWYWRLAMIIGFFVACAVVF